MGEQEAECLYPKWKRFEALMNAKQGKEALIPFERSKTTLGEVESKASRTGYKVRDYTERNNRVLMSVAKCHLDRRTYCGCNRCSSRGTGFDG